ncbi:MULTISPECIES: LysR family transcriptional regulator [Variovorax]|jgi:LysR family transcriptional regulator, hypochlorite-specific transcription factor HypT|uniref:LysR family transcriptional regulator n=1 Tax=Variovorax TaxID=34072 RepID=UPI00086904ED|nr:MULTISPECIES: LysR substrate-binding domain-containing protein [Variovorax]MBN8754690.1 LysR family transcriptional regulator [Variovorax sp.]ODU19405.1 MAG: LysR family transcriptional regulator [Variovorax sp. SCN 67-85]ODV25306.1 MAG: LysR family transcriptional regulator [Variovorax sp. SCN 67-20]OJZ03125.1 MAG: LysR family transcriptional regulator [Variovorax sp. 67-131]UKI08210.1 LysR substrate-binding domain-containing protein [Variovorax paradoxus]
MQFKWMEDFIVLAQTRSFTRAAELRHVTHPAFGRRIRALESWAGTPLVERASTPVALTPAGESFLENATQMVRGVDSAREEIHTVAGREARTVTLVTGRTLARTVMADWLVRLQPVLRGGEVRVLTGALAETVRMLEHNEVDFSLIFHHAALTFRLDGRQFAHVTVASDKLVPVSRADAQGRPAHSFEAPGEVPFLSYVRTLAMGRLVEDLLAHNPHAPRLKRHIECDSADALYEYVLRGLGVAWLPWSMVQADCKAGRLVPTGGRRMEVRFEVRLYRPKRRLGTLAEDVWRAMGTR